jgi:hypothetical protein
LPTAYPWIRRECKRWSMGEIASLPGRVLLVAGLIQQRLEEAEGDVGDAAGMRAHLAFVARQLEALIAAARIPEEERAKRKYAKKGG